MSFESHESSLFNRLDAPSRKSRLETYIYDEVSPNTEEIADELANPYKPLAKTVVAIPVAAHQEAGMVTRTLDLYSQQVGARPFSVCLLLNYPESEKANPVIGDTIQAVVSAQKQHADALDIRSAMREYKDGQPIGAIRKDLWDAVGILAIEENMYKTPSDEVIIVNNDIDTESLSKHYIASIQRTYEMEQLRRDALNFSSDLLLTHSTQVRHALRPKTHPKTSAGILWMDLLSRVGQDGGVANGYEAGIVVPLATYARVGGFNPDDKTYETSVFFGHKHIVTRSIRNTALQTSPRRFLEKFPALGYDIWSDETFGDQDACRRDSERSYRDATQTELDAAVMGTIENASEWYVAAGLKVANQILARKEYGVPEEEREALRESEYDHQVSVRLNLAKRALLSVVKNYELSELFPSLEDARPIMKRLTSL